MLARMISSVLRILNALCRRILGQSVHSVNHTTPSHRKAARDRPSSKIEHYSRIQALLIGIDRYQSVDLEALEAAVADTLSVRDYLHKDLHVPLNQIAILHNETATRMAIIQQLHRFRKRRKLRRGDPILIFFAGHGAITKAKTTTDRAISMVLPHDVVTVKDDDGIGEFRGAISTRTLDEILGTFAADESIGDNITVIFDCCKSPVNRLPYEDDCATYDLSSSLWVSQDSDSSRPYVLLSACGADESAFEREGRGGFTDALLTVLRQFRAECVTYRDILEYLPCLPRQTPRCEGLYVDRFIFQTRAPEIKSSAFRVFADGYGQYMINAGRLHGISTGARFSVQSCRYDTDAVEHPLSVLQATEVRDFNTVLSTAPGARLLVTPLPPCFAIQTSSGDDLHVLRLHVMGDSDSALRTLVMQEMAKAGLLVNCGSPEHADLSIVEGDRGIEYLICASEIQAYGLNRLCSTTPLDQCRIGRVLRAAHHFFRFLHLEPPTERALRTFVNVEVHELKRARSTTNTAGLTGVDESIRDYGVVRITADEVTNYGITIQSLLDISLHVWVFYFDHSDLSIVELYKPPVWGVRGRPSLPPRGLLSVDGSGPGRGEAFASHLRPGQDVDVGFLKIFMSTEPLDLSYVAQKSPFEGNSPRGIRLKKQESERAWDIITINVVQLKPNANSAPDIDTLNDHRLSALQDEGVREVGGHESRRGDDQ